MRKQTKNPKMIFWMICHEMNAGWNHYPGDVWLFCSGKKHPGLNLMCDHFLENPVCDHSLEITMYLKGFNSHIKTTKIPFHKSSV